MLRLIVAWIVAVASAITAAYIAVLMHTQIKNRRNQVRGKIIYIGDDFYVMVPINRQKNNKIRPYKRSKKI